MAGFTVGEDVDQDDVSKLLSYRAAGNVSTFNNEPDVWEEQYE